MSKKFKNARRITGLDSNVWVEFSNLSTYSTVVNFGQGQPHISPPIYVKEELAKVAATHKMNQYTWGFESI
uniref:Aminotransferase class I/classII domain-containing protein n=1 Tax=Vombatus ursinus TaxID=29139 RepID=A0A4X2KT87_VOMUR